MRQTIWENYFDLNFFLGVGGSCSTTPVKKASPAVSAVRTVQNDIEFKTHN